MKSLTQKPTLLIQPMIQHKMEALVKETNTEIAWHGFIKQINENTFELYDIKLYPQEVSGSFVDCKEEEYMRWLDDLWFEHPEDFKQMRFHGHSHVNMGTTPSQLDLNFREELIKNIKNNRYYFFVILNKHKDMHIELYDLDRQVIYQKEDINVIYLDNEEAKQIKQWIDDETGKYVEEKEYTTCSTIKNLSNFLTPVKYKTKPGIRYKSSVAELLEEPSELIWGD